MDVVTTTLQRLMVGATTTGGGAAADGTISPFDRFRQALDDATDGIGGDDRRMVTTADFSKLTTKFKGDLFEAFCVRYLEKIVGCDRVVLWRDLDPAFRAARRLPFQDMGIDLVAWKGTAIWAVQCKYRTKPTRAFVPHKRIPTDTLGWKDISTFYSLVNRSGPWNRVVVMTTARCIRRIGGRRPEDLSFCQGSFEKLTYDQWMDLAGFEGQTVGWGGELLAERADGTGVALAERLTQEEMRVVRLARFDS